MDSLPFVGYYSMPVTFYGPPIVQTYLDTGLMHTFGFDQPAARRMALQSIAKSQTAACPMCYWLAAMSLAPYLNHPILSEDTLIKANAAAQQAAQAAAGIHVTVKEQGLIDAITVRFVVGNQTAGYQANRDRMRAFVDQMPQDTDILAFYVDSLLVLHCDETGYHFYEPDNLTPLPELLEAIQVLQHCLELSSSSKTIHPLCAHLYIHVTEPSNRPGRASGVANELATVFADTQAQHLQHMPSHTHLRIGRYHDAVQNNLKAHESDESWLQHGSLPYGSAHDTAFLIHAAGLSGERTVAYDYANQLRHHYRQYPDQPDRPDPELS